jgi:hypothetical protein
VTRNLRPQHSSVRSTLSEKSRAHEVMMRARTCPVCDRHRNLQMIAYSLERPSGTISGHFCPSPAAGVVMTARGTSMKRKSRRSLKDPLRPIDKLPQGPRF